MAAGSTGTTKTARGARHSPALAAHPRRVRRTHDVGEVYLFDRAASLHITATGTTSCRCRSISAFLWSPWDAQAFREQVAQSEALLPPAAQPVYVLSSHDAPRHRTRFDDPQWGRPARGSPR